MDPGLRQDDNLSQALAMPLSDRFGLPLSTRAPPLGARRRWLAEAQQVSH